MSYGQLQTALSRLRDKGALSEGDVSRALPRSAMRDIKGIGAYLGMGTGDDMLSPEEIANIANMLGEKKAGLLETQRLGKSELEKRAGSLAPTLNRTGRLPKVMESLGYAREQQIAPPSDGADLRSAAQKELERRRKAQGQ